MSVGFAALIAAGGGIAFLLRDQGGGWRPEVDVAAAGMTTRHVGSAACIKCHEAEHGDWKGSHHDLAMAAASEDSVLGDFDDAMFEQDGVVTTFFRKDDGYWVRTEGADGQLGEFEITHTFGVKPLQQYLIAGEGGRFQALGVAWDSRAKESGGQRWFSLYPDERLEAGDALHWTGRGQNWNFMCAACHSTGLEKGYDAAGDSYETTWSEIDVSCEACHEPGAAHVAWAEGLDENAAGEGATVAEMGLGVDLKADGNWVFDEGAPTARLEGTGDPKLRNQGQIESCSPCHSRRSAITMDTDAGGRFLDQYQPALLTDGLYHADGQILDEVYVYGSFVQSKMYAKGVACTDCHDAHSERRLAEGNALCLKCHSAELFNTPAHLRHTNAAGTDASWEGTGAACVDCHMPNKTYMQVDNRRDHSFKIPRPDLTAEIGVPNACNGCHDDQTADWAAAQMDAWYGDTWRSRPEFARAIHAGRVGAHNAPAMLEKTVRDQSMPGIARATALELLGGYGLQRTTTLIKSTKEDADPLVRLGAIKALAAMSAHPTTLSTSGLDFLRDPVRAIRIEAARALAPAASYLAAGAIDLFESAEAEYIAAQLVNVDRAESHVNLGVLHAQRGRLDQAEAAFARAIELDERFVAAYVNLSDILRAAQRDTEGEAVIRAGLAIEPDAAALHHALGLALVRLGRKGEGIKELDLAAERGQDVARYGYVHAIAMMDVDGLDAGLAALEDVHERHPLDPTVLEALVSINAQNGQMNAALKWANKWIIERPYDETGRAWRDALRDQQGGG